MNVMRQVVITPVLNGFKVQVGCQELVYTNIENLASDLVAYQKNPQAIEDIFIKDAVNKTMGVPITEAIGNDRPLPSPVAYDATRAQDINGRF